MSGKDPKGDTRSAARRAVHGRGKQGKQDDAASIEARTRDSGPPLGDGYEHDLAWFCFQDDGWLRVVPDADLLRVHLKWKFSRGDHHSHYVYVVGYVSDLRNLLMYLRRKVVAVRELRENPVRDRPYNAS